MRSLGTGLHLLAHVVHCFEAAQSVLAILVGASGFVLNCPRQFVLRALVQ